VRHVKILVLTVHVGLTKDAVILESVKLFAVIGFVKQVNKEYVKLTVNGAVMALVKAARVAHLAT